MEILANKCFSSNFQVQFLYYYYNIYIIIVILLTAVLQFNYI